MTRSAIMIRVSKKRPATKQGMGTALGAIECSDTTTKSARPRAMRPLTSELKMAKSARKRMIAPKKRPSQTTT